MLRLTFLLCSCLFLVMLLGGRDFGQLRPGLALAAAEAKVAPVTAAVPAVETVAIAADEVVPAPAVRMPIVTPRVVAAPVVAAADVAPVPVVEPAASPVFTLANYADATPLEAAAVVPEAAAEGEIWYVAGNSLNVRAGPSTDDAVVGRLTRGEAMLVVAREGDEWAHIKIEGDGIEGYVASRFLSAEVPAIN